MFHLIKTIVWIVGFIVIALFILSYFGYEINKNYFQERKDDCKSRLTACRKELIHQGLDNAKCNFNCINPKLIIKEK